MGKSGDESRFVDGIASFFPRSSLHVAQGHCSRRYANSKWLECPSAQEMSTPAPVFTWIFTAVGFLRWSIGVGMERKSFENNWILWLTTAS
jgi:hypothetical protein